MPGVYVLSLRIPRPAELNDEDLADAPDLFLFAAGVDALSAMTEPLEDGRALQIQVWTDGPADVAAVCEALAKAGIVPLEISVREETAQAGDMLEMATQGDGRDRLDFGAFELVRSCAPVPRDAGVIHLWTPYAFGDGFHPTTRMCVEAMIMLRDEGFAAGHALDVGTGSGILAVVAATLFGAGVTGTDVEAAAIAAARENWVRNGLRADDLQVLLDESLTEVTGDFPLVLANILKGPLGALAPRIAALQPAGGRLVLSGLLAAQVAAVAGVYEGLGYRLLRRRDDGEWACLVMGR